MKARKEYKHTPLIGEVSMQLLKYFKPNPRNIKRRIEDLIQRQYLKRDQNDPALYHYLA